MEKIHVGLIGFGTVGSGLAKTLLSQRERLEKKVGIPIKLSRVADINLAVLPDEYEDVTLSADAGDILSDPDIDIVVELIGGTEPAKSFLLEAIRNGKHVITANKALLSTHGREIFEAAAAHNVEVGFEASVGGGIPVIKALKEGLTANRIEVIRGIMNGTANYILTMMTEHGTPFDEVLKDAQEKGFAEADPKYDVEGIDTAHKLAILMSIAYGQHVHLDDIYVEGISSIMPIDIDFAKEFGYRIKLLAISRNHGNHMEARVHPTMVPEKSMLANINGSFNAIQITGDTVGDTLFYGHGAGMMPTGSAVAADVVDIARNIISSSINRVPPLSYLPEHFTAPSITPMGELTCPYYFRVTVLDEPGVLSAISGILGKHGISIRSVIQKGEKPGKPVHVVLRAHMALESSVQNAVEEINALDFCTEPTVTIRVQIDED
ncbi:MAG: homoserine dehydrogenase [Desulfofustis sp.]|nr:homoserine dehydrogenase [Desulfofustis sp.]NNF45892.1 homoserine dehydrogenase [Desulfofustis sp.]NNK56331.1 homoserine dehydrogenase [Desulfofustis sp.]